MIDNFYFGLKGTSAFVRKDDYEIFAIIDPEKSVEKTKIQNQHFQYFGIEDSVVNTIAISHD